MRCFCFLLLVISCATTQPNFEKSEVVERIGDKEKTPPWATGEMVSWSEKGNFHFSAIVSMDANAKKSACMDAAAVKAKTEILGYIMDKMTQSAQLSGGEVASDPEFETMKTSLSKGTLHGVSVEKRFWETKTKPDSSTGLNTLALNCAAVVKIKKNELAKQLKEATSKNNNIREKIRNALISEQEKFIQTIE